MDSTKCLSSVLIKEHVFGGLLESASFHLNKSWRDIYHVGKQKNKAFLSICTFSLIKLTNEHDLWMDYCWDSYGGVCFQNKTHNIHNLNAMMKLIWKGREMFLCVLLSTTPHTKRISGIICKNKPFTPFTIDNQRGMKPRDAFFEIGVVGFWALYGHTLFWAWFGKTFLTYQISSRSWFSFLLSKTLSLSFCFSV